MNLLALMLAAAMATAAPHAHSMMHSSAMHGAMKSKSAMHTNAMHAKAKMHGHMMASPTSKP